MNFCIISFLLEVKREGAHIYTSMCAKYIVKYGRKILLGVKLMYNIFNKIQGNNINLLHDLINHHSNFDNTVLSADVHLHWKNKMCN
jgi:hypothetical protein